MTISILWLRDVTSGERDAVGGKGAGLAALMRAGFDVPDGFVIPATAAMQLAGPPQDWAADVRRTIADAFELLRRDGAVAVRSSATDEDSDTASFAGQHETVLNVGTSAELESAVSACVASLGSAAAQAYRARAGASGAAMAVVVQRMVDAAAAGVAFSTDPTTGDPSHVVVEAVRGTGEALVGGTVEGERTVLQRDAFAVIERSGRGESVLSEDQARAVGRAAVRAEEAFGTAQDIEFAFDHEGKLWLLQSRPVTTTASTDGWVSEFDTETDDQTLWTSANVQEILPGLLTPLTMSVFEEMVPRAYTRDYQRLKLLDRDENPVFMGTFYNRVFLNLTATKSVADRALGGSGDTMEHRYLGGEYTEKVKTVHSRTIWKHRVLSAPPLVKTLLTLTRSADRIDAETSALVARANASAPASLSDAELDAFRNEVLDFGGRIAPIHLQVTGVAGTAFDAVTRMIQPILKEETEGRVPTLFSGMRGVESAQIGLDLWELARIARREGIEPDVRKAGFDPRGAGLPDAWRTAFAAFIERHGHRGLKEMEATAHTWQRDPGPVVSVVRSYLDLAPDHAPPATLARQEAERLRLTAELKKRMNPVKRPLFAFALKQAQGWVALRERTKSIVVRAARIPDTFVPELQRRLLERGVVAEADDIYFLTNAELSAFLRGAPDDLRPAVARRRREYERNRYVVLPERFNGRPKPIEPDLSHHKGDVLTGTPVSPGVITGRARIILDPERDGPLLPGEVLVAPVTDAGWTPLFALASALVVDMGSALSHGSTVAREYGLPAVVNVRRGTTSIRSGDLVTVNGSKGTVTILEG